MATEAMIISCCMTSVSVCDGAMDQAGAIVGGDDVDASGEAGLEVLDFVFDVLGDGEGILAMAHEDGAAGDFVAIFLEHAAAELGAELDGGDAADIDRRAFDFLDDGVFDILFAFDPADATDDVFGIVFLNDTAAGGHVAFADGRIEVAEGDAVGAQIFGTDVDLIFQRRAADDGDVGHTLRRVQTGGDVELVQGPKFAGIDGVGGIGFDGVPDRFGPARWRRGPGRGRRQGAERWWPGLVFR